MSEADPEPSSQIYRERLPRPEIGGLVSCIWVQQVSPAGPAYEHRAVPNGCVEIACRLGTGLVRVAGPKRLPTVARLAPGETVVGLRLRPGAAPAILGQPASDLVELELDLERLRGVSAVTLGERLAEAGSPADAARLLEEEVLTRAGGVAEPDPLVAEVVGRLQPWRSASVGDATSDLFVSPRQLRRRFVAAIGYGPKALQRILRFQGFLALGDTRVTGHMPLARLAVTVGYADQAHLTRECSRLSGLTPTAFLEELRRSCSPGHDHTVSFAGLRHALLDMRTS